jgi:LPS export ABC transporter protein LptC
MRGARLIGLLLVLALGAVAFWFVQGRQGSGAGTARTDEAPQAAYDYEAHDVVLRQMGPDGRLAYQVEAKEITQLPANGRVTARGLTLYHDPPGTPVGGPNRWTLTADSGELPVEGGVITLSGNVRAHGIPVGKPIALTVTTEHLQYDMAAQELRIDEAVKLVWGTALLEGRSLRVNIGTGKFNLGPGDATAIP